MRRFGDGDHFLHFGGEGVAQVDLPRAIEMKVIGIESEGIGHHETAIRVGCGNSRLGISHGGEWQSGQARLIDGKLSDDEWQIFAIGQTDVRDEIG